MSNKPFYKLNSLDKALRRALPPEGFAPDRTQVTIQKICGFELFNTRPYHNYENWSDGYIIFDDDIRVSEEDLDDAVNKYVEFRTQLNEGKEIPIWHRNTKNKSKKE